MCGIGGIHKKHNKVGIDELHRMIGAIKHRGPDGNNFVNDDVNNFGLVHARLSIIDLLTGDQPMYDVDKELLIAYNGELYNFKDLRQDLEKAGAIFTTQSDTEVILQAYKHWSVHCLDHFRGMFAFCIVDYRLKKFFLARDHFGIKPLYYYLRDGQFLFSSELAGIVSVNPHLTLDFKAIDYYLWLQYIPAPFTAFADVRKLLPGNYLQVSFDHKFCETKPYWKFGYNYKPDITRNQWIEQLETTIEKSVKAHLVSDVPFGAFLSGGLDSTLVVEYMQKNLNRPVKTFSIGFSDDECSELKYASFVSKKLNTEHHEEMVHPDALRILPELVSHYGEPFGDSSAVPTYYVSKLARVHVPMVLSGDGGDEAFFGYQSYANWIKYIRYDGVRGYKKPFHPMLSRVFPAKYPGRTTYQGWMDMVRYLPYAIRKNLWRSDALQAVSWKSDEFFSYFNEVKSDQLISKAQYTDLKTYLPDDILTKVDRASMLHGLEVRTPLIDIDVWNLVAQIPPENNFAPGDPMSGKSLIKEILLKRFPREFVLRKKQGFAIPANKWLAGNHFQERISAMVSSTSQLSGIFNKDSIQDVLNRKNGNWIWLLLVLEEWLTQIKSQKK
jgi:asparagine synthase (glutamine-hydrolysing)